MNRNIPIPMDIYTNSLEEKLKLFRKLGLGENF